MQGNREPTMLGIEGGATTLTWVRGWPQIGKPLNCRTSSADTSSGVDGPLAIRLFSAPA